MRSITQPRRVNVASGVSFSMKNERENRASGLRGITRHLTFLVQPASARKTLISVRSVSNELTLDAPASPHERQLLEAEPGSSIRFLPVVTVVRSPRYLVENVPSGKKAQKTTIGAVLFSSCGSPRARDLFVSFQSSLGGLEDVELPENRGNTEDSWFLKCVFQVSVVGEQCVVDSKIFKQIGLFSGQKGRGSFVDLQETTSLNLGDF